MRYFLIFLYCFPLVVFSQEKNTPQNLTDSVTVKNKIRFLDPGWKRHNHIVDFNTQLGFIYIQRKGGALGYRYLYRPEWAWDIKLGGRVGFWFNKNDHDIGSIGEHWYSFYSISINANAPIWKKLNLDLSTGYLNWINSPTKTNILDEKKLYYGYGYFYQNIGLNMVFFKYLTIDSGVSFDLNLRSKKMNPKWYLTFGIKF